MLKGSASLEAGIISQPDSAIAQHEKSFSLSSKEEEVRTELELTRQQLLEERLKQFFPVGMHEQSQNFGGNYLGEDQLNVPFF